MKTYGIEEMSVLFKLAPSTIQNHLKRKPWTLPPRVVIPGSSRLLWIADTVDSWLLMHEEKEVKNPRKNFKSLPAEKTVSLNENIKHITPHPFQKNHWRGF